MPELPQYPPGVLYLQVRHPFGKSIKGIVSDNNAARLIFDRLYGETPILAQCSLKPDELWWIDPTSRDSLYPLMQLNRHLSYEVAMQWVETDDFVQSVASELAVTLCEKVEGGFILDTIKLVVLGDLFRGRSTYAERVLERVFPGAILEWPESARQQEPISLDERVDSIGLTSRIYNRLMSSGINTVRDLVAKSELELQAIPNLGQKSIDAIIEVLDVLGLKLRED